MKMRKRDTVRLACELSTLAMQTCVCVEDMTIYVPTNCTTSN